MSRNLFLATHKKKNNCSYLKANYAIVNIIRHKDVCIKYGRFSYSEDTLSHSRSLAKLNNFPFTKSFSTAVQLQTYRRSTCFFEKNINFRTLRRACALVMWRCKLADSHCELNCCAFILECVSLVDMAFIWSSNAFHSFRNYF